MKKKTIKKTDENLLIFLGKKFKIPEFDGEEIDLKNITKINIRNYEEDLETLPGLLNIFGILQAKAMKRMRKAETDFQVWEAKKDKELREYFEEKEEKYTETKINKEIRLDQEYLKFKNKIFSVQEQYEIVKSVYWSLQNKSEVLLEISRQRGNLKKLKNARFENN